MSTLLVKVKKIDNIEKHPNADTLSILQIGGWNVIAKTEGIIDQTHVLYVPIDSITPREHSLLGFLDGKRVKTVKLRGIISQGLCLPLDEVRDYLKNVKNLADAEIIELIKSSIDNDFNLAEVLDIEKYEPKLASYKFGGEQASPHPLFNKYTELEHYGNFNKALDGELVSVTEKLHGTSARFGLTYNEDDGTKEFVVGSRNIQFSSPMDETKSNLYINIFREFNIASKLEAIKALFPEAKFVGIYGEIAGPAIQGSEFAYGKTKPELFVYDINVDGKYVDFATFKVITDALEIQICPILSENVEMSNDILDLAKGKSTLSDKTVMEGIVIKPVVEKWSYSLGRVALKVISKEYLLKNGVDLKNE